MKCFLDNREAVDSFEVECGNNAELSAILNVCQEHLEEAAKFGYEFEEKYSAQIEEEAWESLRSQADGLR